MSTTESVRARAWSCHQRGQGAEAERLYRQLLAGHTESADAVNLGALLRSQGRLREALEHYQGWLGQFPAAISLRLNAVNCAIEAGAWPQAQQWISDGRRLAPNDRALQQAEARVLMAAGQNAKALPILHQLTQQQPQDPSGWLDLGLAHHRLEKRQEALNAFEQAARLDPSDTRAAANQLTLLKELGRWEAAKALITRLPGAVRESAQVRGALAHLLMERQAIVEAEAEFAQLCALEPEQPLHWLNRAACLRSLKHTVAATQVVKQGLRWHPQHDDLRHALGQNLAELGRHRQAMELLRNSASPEQEMGQQQLFNLQFLGAGYGLIPADERARMARTWESRQRLDGVGSLWADRIRAPIEGRPLRVGYLSADFCNHPVGRFLLPLLQAHNPQQVELVGVNCGPHHDAVTDQLRHCCRHWLDVRFATDLEAARMLSDLKLDVLVELGGYTAGSRLGILVHRPAPVQLSYLGYFAPTYLECVDGWIGDAELFGGLVPEDRRQPLLLVEGGYMAYRDEALPPVERCGSSRFRFGSFNHARKLTPEAIELFCQVMDAVPESELVLKSISFVEPAEQQRVRALFEKAGLATERLNLLPWMEGRENHLACYREIDVALDPLPYGGATTTCEALAMGVPVVSLAGAGMVGRLSASVLASTGCRDWIATDYNDYINIALALATEGPRDVPSRQNLRMQLMNSDLSNAPRLATQLEQLYRFSATNSAKACSR